MSNVVAIRRTPKISDPAEVSAIIVAGSGGAATTTTAFGLATALRIGTSQDVCAVDATTDGGNLLTRTGIGAIDPARSIRQLGSRMAVTSSGVVIVGSGNAGLSTDPALVDELLAARHSARFFDVGTALRSPRLAPLIESGASLVVVAPARAEPLSRMRSAIQWLMSRYGPTTLGETIVVVSHQQPTPPVDLAPVRDALAPRVAGFVEVPFDGALTTPGVIDHRRLATATVDAWTDALDVLSAAMGTQHNQSTTRTGEQAR